MRAVILAGGRQSRWKGRVSKHELVVDGETLLGRTVRLLRDRTVTDIVMVGPYDYGVPRFKANDRDPIDGRLSVMAIAAPKDRTVILMGDVWYSDAAMDAIVTGGHEPCLYARFTGSELTGKRYGEIFANSFLPEHHAETLHLLYEVIKLYNLRRIKRLGWWECYLLAHGKLLPRAIVADHGDAVVIDDWTEDFDKAEDWQRWTVARLT